VERERERESVCVFEGLKIRKDVLLIPLYD